MEIFKHIQRSPNFNSYQHFSNLSSLISFPHPIPYYFLKMCVISCVWLFATPWTVACQTPLSVEFSGKNTGVCCHFLLQGIFLTQGWKLHLLHCRQISYHCVTWEVHHFLNDNLKTTIRKRIWSENEEQSFKWKNSRLNRNFKMSHFFLILLHPNMNFVLNPCLRTTC